MNVLKKLSTILFPNTDEPYQISDPTAVKVDPQELTESQQMQARKNLGVYHKQGEKIDITWDGDVKNTSGVITFPEGYAAGSFYKVSSLVPNDDLIKTGTAGASNGTKIVFADIWPAIEQGGLATEELVFAEMLIIVRKENVKLFDTVIPETGIYFLKTDEVFVSDFVFGEEIFIKIPIEYLTFPSDIEIVANFDDGTFSTSITFDDAWQLSAAELSRRIVLHNSEETKADLQGISPTSVSKSAIRSIGNHIIIEVNGPYAASGETYTYGEEPMVLCWSESGVSIMTKAV